MFTEDIKKIKNILIVGNRYLVRFRNSYGTYSNSVSEISIIEKAEKYVKVREFRPNSTDYVEWKSYCDIEVVEELKVSNILKSNNANNRNYETNDSESSLLNPPFKYYNN